MDIVYQVLKAQQANLARIATGLVMPGTTGGGDQIELFGPKPDVIRLYDRPLRLLEDDTLQGWERIVTLMPIQDTGAGRNVGRNDRTLSYQIGMIVRLNAQEEQEDHAQVSVNGVTADNPLARKVHSLVHDFHHVFFDNMLLTSDECPTGLVDDAGYTLSWDAEVDYPTALVVATITCQISAV